MSEDLARLFPDGFWNRYRTTYGSDPPEGLCWIYDLLCQALYFGIEAREEVSAPVGSRRGTRRADYWFGDSGLLEPKTQADVILSGLEMKPENREEVDRVLNQVTWRLKRRLIHRNILPEE